MPTTAPPATTYLVECYWPGVTERRLLAAVARARAGGTSAVHCRGALLLPADETAFVLFEADSEEAVRDASTRGGLPFERVVACTAFAGAAAAQVARRSSAVATTATAKTSSRPPRSSSTAAPQATPASIRQSAL